MFIKILIVDDSASDRLIIKNMLNEYNVLTASDGAEALRMHEEHDGINMMILDLNMPRMNGFQVLEALKMDGRYRNLRTIILTNYDELDNEIKGLKLGAVDYIRKPIHMDSLKARIDVHAELLHIQHILEQKIYEQGLTFDTIFHQAPVGIAISHDMDPLNINCNIITSINTMFEQITGRTKEELIKLGWGKITHPDDLKEDMKNFRKLQSGEIKSYSMDKRYIRPDSSIVWVHMIVAPLTLSDEHQYNHICLVQDITERKTIEKALIESERSKSILLSNLPGMAYRCVYDQAWTMQFVSEGCYDLTGYRPESLLNNKDLSFNDLITAEFREPLWKEWERILANRQQFRYEYEITTSKGERKWVLELGEGIYNENGKVGALEGIILDISDRKEMESHLRYTSQHDMWTGLYNRRYLEDILKQDNIRPFIGKRALVSINLSAMYSLTLTYGFHYSQELIKKVAEALKGYCSGYFQLFSTYEYQFVFYATAYKDKAELRAFCESVADTLDSLLGTEKVSGGLGVIEIDENNQNDVDQLLKNLLVTSEKAINTLETDIDICFFEKDMEIQIIREHEIDRELTQIALGENPERLFLQYQPILDLQTNQICGFEALARLNSNTYGRVTPLEFIPIMEKTKLIIPLGERIILQSFHFLNMLKKYGFDTITVSINISAIQLYRNDFVKNLVIMVDEAEVNPKNIALEITESVFASDYDKINKIIGELQAHGMHIALDDFGTGYSSLARERELKIDCLKIDKYFIDKLLELKFESTITSDIISMGHKLGHCIIAEGVEYENQREYLEHYGCDRIQGYLISKPLDESDAIDLIKKMNSTENKNLG